MFPSSKAATTRKHIDPPPPPPPPPPPLPTFITPLFSHPSLQNFSPALTLSPPLLNLPIQVITSAELRRIPDGKGTAIWSDGTIYQGTPPSLPAPSALPPSFPPMILGQLAGNFARLIGQAGMLTDAKLRVWGLGSLYQAGIVPDAELRV